MVKPFIKWVGGKRKLLPKILDMFPTEFNEFYEPFVGGGAVFLNAPIGDHKGHINDINRSLYEMYLIIRDDRCSLLMELKKLEKVEITKDFYYIIRDKYNEKLRNGLFDAECIAYFVWLNKHSFNGLYRVNSRGEYNAPYNNSKSFNIAIDSLGDINIRLKCVTIHNEPFEVFLNDVKCGDFVYLDPPYLGCFSDYNSGGFSRDDFIKLKEILDRMNDIGAKWLLSNSVSDNLKDALSNYDIIEVDAIHSINSDGNNRRVKELLIKNYQ